MRRVHRAARLVGVAAAGAALATVAASCADDDGRASATPVRWISAGDSFASGVGLDDAAGECGTSVGAYGPGAHAAVADTLNVEQFAHVACSGARIADVGDQLDGARDTAPNLITLDAGGNDVGFFDIGVDCVGADDLVDRGCDVTSAELAERIATIEDDLVALYRQAAEIVGPDGLVIVLTYPQLIADPDRWPDDVGASCGALHAEDVATLREVTNRLDDAIADAARSVDGVEVLDVRDAFEDHGRCGPAAPWINGVSPSLRSRPFRGSFHPNDLGYGAEAELLADRLRDRYNGS